MSLLKTIMQRNKFDILNITTIAKTNKVPVTLLSLIAMTNKGTEVLSKNIFYIGKTKCCRVLTDFQ